MNYDENNEVIKWLLEGPKWVEYRTRKDILKQNESIVNFKSFKKEIENDMHIKGLLLELKAWPGSILKRHNDATHLIHKIVFLSEIGLTKNIEIIEKVCIKITSNFSDEGLPQILMNIPEKFGGTGKDEFSWMLCDSPLVLYSLINFGYDTKEIDEAVNFLLNLSTDQGWMCAVSPKLGNFRGPGRKSDPCPYSTLLMLKLLSLKEKWRKSSQAKRGVETLLSLWEQRKERRPYLFAMGTSFKKLKVPLLWYDILHVLDVLSHFSMACEDQRFGEILEIVLEKADTSGKFTAESIWRAWKDWEFGQKKFPSRWITFLVLRILTRLR